MPEDPGFKVTIKDVYNKVDDLQKVLDPRLRKIEQQVAAQWVVVGIVVVGLGGLFTKTIIG